MIRIAYIVSTLRRCGPVNQLKNIIKNLDRSKFYPIVITLSPEPDESLKEEFIELDVEWIRLNLSRIKGIFNNGKIIKKILEEKEIDIVHTQGIRADVLSAKYLKSYFQVSTLRNYPYHDYVMKFGKIKGYLMSVNHIRATKKIPNSIGCSKSTVELYNKNHNLNIDYIQNGVDIIKFKRCFSKNEIKIRYGLPLDKKIYITVGSLIERKDPLTIIEAFNMLNVNEEKILVILGDGTLRKECEKLINNNDKIILIGEVKDVNNYLQAADYFISASKSEGLPNTVLEAMACGLPVILSDIPSHNEILDFDRKSGVIFSIGNPKELYLAMLNIEKMDYDILSKRAEELINENLSDLVMSKKYQKFYSKITTK